VRRERRRADVGQVGADGLGVGRGGGLPVELPDDPPVGVHIGRDQDGVGGLVMLQP